MALNRQLPTVDASRFAMVPRHDVPRSTFVVPSSLKTTFDAGWLVPIYLDEVLPGDVHKGNVTLFARLATPLFPIMDAMTLETFFFFVPNRLVWENWTKMMGERLNPDSSISFTTPQVESEDEEGFPILSIYDYFGLPTVGQVQTGFGEVSVNAMPLRGYNLIWNSWFRDQNLQNSLTVPTDDGPDDESFYNLKRRNKKHDYFTSCLPYPLKGGVEVSMGFTGLAPVLGIGFGTANDPTNGNPANVTQTDGTLATGWAGYFNPTAGAPVIRSDIATTGSKPMVFADLSTATGQTINALRLANATQRLLERDMRSGTRYTELLRAHFGVTPEDTRLQRPEYIGGGRTNIQTQAIPQTAVDRNASTNAINNPLGAIGAAATATDQHRFSYSATEHGFIIGLVHLTGEITYQQGIHRMWKRLTRYDHYWPEFAHLGEQAVTRGELFYTSDPTNDDYVFGYQERYAEYRYAPSRITGLFKSTSAGNIDPWHLAQEFSGSPILNSSFIEDAPPVSRVLAAGSLANGMQMIFDSYFKVAKTRAMPMYSVPGMMDRF